MTSAAFFHTLTSRLRAIPDPRGGEEVCELS